MGAGTIESAGGIDRTGELDQSQDETIKAPLPKGSLGKRSHKKQPGTGTKTGTRKTKPTAGSAETARPDNRQETIAADKPTPDKFTVSEEPTPILTPGAIAGAVAQSENDAQGAAIVFLALLDGISVMALGPGFTMNPVEKSMIEEPLTRILARTGIGSSLLFQKYSDPLLLAMGLIAWGSRIARERAERKAELNPAPAPAPAKPGEPAASPAPESPAAPEPELYPINEALPAPALVTNQFAGEPLK